ncbi:GYDIA family GHMP kinase [Chryseobacterium suipulveris]|uniref:GYDIA family GHMP kinase n=1 Tax=Chryseobacterium suipulveris TaxID=2929800 RepID=A0ABY4BXZ3_9FLAO|nr:GYDIA family GHMP kinase [Chryseobacterium suipulveris]UOE41395.1 GYDIA family GHMP kinase [Chryseobacterium suipulveris]
MGKIFSPGKLLLTSEYAVLDGALALALPTKLGQEFFFEEIEDGNSHISWIALHQESLWLNVQIEYRNWEIINANIPEAAFILKVLKNVQQLSSIRFKGNNSYLLRTNLQFPANFGLGSSSTLMNNLAEWAQVDPFRLNEISLGGSGYDIAVAKEKSAILYQNSGNERFIEKVVFNPDFRNDLIFIHLNQKQDSREGINLYRSKEKSATLIEEFSNITKELLNCKDLEKFSELMGIHERKLSAFLGITAVKEKYFENCPVFVKSLGAWGGDFVLSRKFSGFQDYFSGKGFSAIFEWDDLIG